MISTTISEKRFIILFTAFFMFFGFLLTFIGHAFLPKVSYDGSANAEFTLRDHLNKYYTPIQMANTSYSPGISGYEVNFPRGYVGLEIAALPGPGLKIAGSGGKHGILVKNVYSGSPAYKSGIAAGNIILSINGQTVNDLDGALSALEKSSAGKTIKVILQDKNQIVERNIKTVKWPNFTPFRVQHGYYQSAHN